MARINFPQGISGTEDLPRTRRSLQNCFINSEGFPITRPGIKELNTTERIARANFVWNSRLYQVASEDLIKIKDIGVSNADFDVLDTIEGSEAIQTAVGNNDAVVVVKTGKIYTIDKNDVVTDISGNANFVPCVSVAHIDGRFVYIPASGDPAFFSDVGLAGTVQVASFFDAETLPDKNNQVFVLNNTLYIMGTDSIELFINRGTTPVPFVRRGGGAIDVGFIGGLLEYRNTFIFIGREKNQDAGIFQIGTGNAPKISNEAIDLILSTYTEAELAEAIPGRLKWRGNDIATFTLRRDSLGFVNGNWIRLETVFDGTSRPWGGGFIAQFEGKYYTAFDDKIGRFEKLNKDYGNSFTRVIDFPIEQEDNEFFSIQSLDLGISQGVNEQVGSVSLSMSDNGVNYHDPVIRNLGDLGQYGKILSWNYKGGLGNYEGFAAVRLSTAEDIVFSNDYISIDASGKLMA